MSNNNGIINTYCTLLLEYHDLLLPVEGQPPCEVTRRGILMYMCMYNKCMYVCMYVIL